MSFLRIETAASINASSAAQFYGLENCENVREKDHCSLSENYRGADSKIPLVIKLVEYTHKNIVFAVFCSNFFTPQKAVVGKQNNQGCIDVLGNEY